MRHIILTYLVTICIQYGLGETNNLIFPEIFRFGAANAAPQIEGAYLTDLKSETIWDRFAHEYPEIIVDGSNLDIAADSYHKYKEDVAALSATGMDLYRLSIAWARILPSGYKESLNDLGVQYYKNLFSELKSKNIEPLVTLYHWDLPQSLQDELGGWLNETTADLFAEYARICYKLFGDDVKLWITINEPKQVCQSGYGSQWFPPTGRSGIDDYVCSKNVLLAHAKAWHIYEDEFKQKQGGRASIVIDGLWYEPGSDSPQDQEQAETTRQFTFGLYGNPVFLGDWPKIVKDRVAARSKQEGYQTSRLPEFTKEEIDYIHGTYDFLALNHYSTSMVNATDEPPIGTPSFYADMGGLEWKKPEWPKANVDWFTVVPWGLRKQLNWLRDTYGNIEIFITENGLSDGNGTLEDDHRVSYIRDYLSNCLDAIYDDDVNLTTYFLWSIIDDWEWNNGYTSAMGLYQVNFTDPNRTRTPRRSSEYFTQITKNRCLVDNEKCINPLFKK